MVERPPWLTYLPVYYGATVVFVLLDFGLDFNIRAAFLHGYPGWRVFYYFLCLAIFAVALWRADLAAWLAVAESLVALSSLIVSTALQVMIVSDEMIEEGRGFVTVAEMLNFLLSGTIGYMTYFRRLRAAGGS